HIPAVVYNQATRLGADQIQPAQQVQRRLAVRGRIDPVIHERRSQSDRTAGVAGRRRETRKIASQCRRRGYECLQVGGIFTNRGSLKPAEEKQPVRFDRSTEGSAELVPLQRTLGCRKIVARIEKVVAHEFKKVAMKLVRSGLRY